MDIEQLTKTNEFRFKSACLVFTRTSENFSNTIVNINFDKFFKHCGLQFNYRFNENGGLIRKENQINANFCIEDFKNINLEDALWLCTLLNKGDIKEIEWVHPDIDKSIVDLLKINYETNAQKRICKVMAQVYEAFEEVLNNSRQPFKNDDLYRHFKENLIKKPDFGLIDQYAYTN